MPRVFPRLLNRQRHQQQHRDKHGHESSSNGDVITSNNINNNINGIDNNHSNSNTGDKSEIDRRLLLSRSGGGGSGRHQIFVHPLSKSLKQVAEETSDKKHISLFHECSQNTTDGVEVVLVNNNTGSNSTIPLSSTGSDCSSESTSPPQLQQDFRGGVANNSNNNIDIDNNNTSVLIFSPTHYNGLHENVLSAAAPTFISSDSTVVVDSDTNTNRNDIKTANKQIKGKFSLFNLKRNNKKKQQSRQPVIGSTNRANIDSLTYASNNSSAGKRVTAIKSPRNAKLHYFGGSYSKHYNNNKQQQQQHSLKFKSPTSTASSSSASAASRDSYNSTGACCSLNTSEGSKSTTAELPMRLRGRIGKDKANNKNGDNSNKKMTSDSTRPENLWKTAVDPKTGRTYYYHRITRETQWRKPIELATDDERAEMEEKERRQRDFFATMEANILRNMKGGETVSNTSESSDGFDPSKYGAPQRKDKPVSPGGDSTHSSSSSSTITSGAFTTKFTSIPKASMVRTISAMDETVLRDLVQSVPSYRRLGSSRDISIPNLDDHTDVHTSENNADPKSQHLQSIMEAMNESMSSHMSSSAMDIMSPTAVNSSNASSFRSTPRPILGRQTLPEQLTVAKQPSMGTLIADLPNELGERQRSFYGTSALDESELELCSEEESKALRDLATITDQMMGVGLDDSITQFNASTNLQFDEDDFLGDISEGSDEDRGENTPGTNRGNILSVNSMDSYDSIQEQEVLDANDGNDRNNSNNKSGDLDSGNQTQQHRPSITSSTSVRTIPNPSIRRPKMARRNTCGTLYVGSTLSAPDQDATIKCVCGVYRAHILQSELEKFEPASHLMIFNDAKSDQKTSPAPTVRPPIPSHDEITNFYRSVFTKAQMEADCVIMSLIYVERLIKSTQGDLRPSTLNWRSLLFSCMVLSSKVWDDLSMWNADFGQTSPKGVTFSLKRVNELEVSVLSALGYNVKVHASEYAKYYFLLRSMLIKSGLGGDELQTMDPLDVEGAKRLQHMSSQFQAMNAPKKGSMLGSRSRSDGSTPSNSPANFKKPLSYDLKSKVSLEHVVHM